MHCRACDDLLSDRETNRKTASGEYPDLCDRCFGTIADVVEVTENPLFESDVPLGELANDVDDLEKMEKPSES